MQMKLNHSEAFSFQLMKEGFRQLSTIGVMSMIILIFPIFFGGVIDGGYSLFNPSNVDYMLPCSVLTPCIYLAVVPIMTLYLFRFLNSRKSSDFYYSIPKSRICILTSYGASILSWSGVLLLVDLLCSYGYYLLQTYSERYAAEHPAYGDSVVYHPTVYQISWGDTGKYLLCILICVLLVFGAIIIAMSITGVRLNNIVVAGLILFTPIIFKMFLTSLLADCIYDMPQQYLPKYAQIHYMNMTVAMLTDNVGSGVFTGTFWNNVIYNLGIIIVYFAAGAWLFHKRKSETAMQPAAYPWVQSMIRCILVSTVTLVPLAFILERRLTYRHLYSDSVLMMYLICLIGAVLYELLTTRKLRNPLKQLPEFLIIIGINLCIYFGMTGISQVYEKFQPEPSEIDYVILKNSDDLLENCDITFHGRTYLNTIIQNEKVENLEIFKLISEDLKKEKKQDDTYYYDSYRQEYIFEIHANGKTYTRTIQSGTSFQDKLYNYYMFHNDRISDYFKLTELTDRELVLDSLSSRCLSQNELRNLYDVYRKELSAMSEDEQRQVLLHTNRGKNEAFTFYLQAELLHRDQPLPQELPIDSLTPKSLQILLSLLWEHTTQLITDISTEPVRVISPYYDYIGYIPADGKAREAFESFIQTDSSDITGNEDYYILMSDNTNKIVGVINQNAFDKFFQPYSYLQ